MLPRLLVSSILQCKYNRHEGTCPELHQAIGFFKPTFIEAQLASKMISTVRSLKLRIKTGSCPEDTITSSNKVIKDFVSDIGVGN
jgi:hypothetical protein